MKLLIQPGDGVAPLVEAINAAKSRVEIAIFRFDRGEIEKALANAASRGVFVHALIAYTNRGGERNLRKLEMRLLEAGLRWRAPRTISSATTTIPDYRPARALSSFVQLHLPGHRSQPLVRPGHHQPQVGRRSGEAIRGGHQTSTIRAWSAGICCESLERA